MENLHYEIDIKAPANKVWDVITGDATYRQWTAPFCEGSYAETDWKEGSKALFLSPGGNGMTSRIKKSEPGRFLSIEHLGEVKDGVEDLDSEKVKQWAGALENYTLEENGATTKFNVDLNITPDFKDYMDKTWPLALSKVKELSE